MIPTTLPVSFRQPIVAIEFDYSGTQRGLTPIINKLVCIGIQASTATVAAGVLMEIGGESDADLYWGRGSPLALMLKWAVRGARRAGSSPRMYGLGIAEPGAGAKHAQTITLAGTASTSGNLLLRIAGRTVLVGISTGDTAAVAAAALASAIAELAPELPVTGGVAGAVVTCTHVVKGETGADVAIDVVRVPAGLTAVVATSTPGSGAVDITASLDLLATGDYHILALENHAATDISDLDAHLEAMWAETETRFRWAVVAETGSQATAQALATAADDEKIVVVSARSFRNTPGEIAAYIGAIRAGKEDPALPLHQLELADLYPPLDSAIPTKAEKEAAIAGGLTILGMNAQKTTPVLVSDVTSKTTLGGVPYYGLAAWTISLGAAYVAKQIAMTVARAMALDENKKRDENTRQRIRALILAMLYRLELRRIVQNVDDHAAELLVEDDPDVPERLVAAVPGSIIPPFRQFVLKVFVKVE